jgi:hypothetical protein
MPELQLVEAVSDEARQEILVARLTSTSFDLAARQVIDASRHRRRLYKLHA